LLDDVEWQSDRNLGRLEKYVDRLRRANQRSATAAPDMPAQGASGDEIAWLDGESVGE